MRWAWALAGVALVAMSSSSRADDRVDCLEAADTGVRIKGCSSIIDANPNDAPAYFTRGVALQARGEIDRAIADYSSAIELNPYHASAYEARARAYVSKGDYVHAVADVTKAGELMSASAMPPKPAPSNEAAAKSAPRAPEEVKTATTAIPKIEKKEEKISRKTSSAPKEMKVAPQANPKVEKKPTPPKNPDTWPAWAPAGQPDP
jgi:tetratricopeptide (TPR) repeat protein